MYKQFYKDKVLKVIDEYRNYRTRTKDYYLKAKESSLSDIKSAMADIVEQPKPEEIFTFLKTLATSSAWVGHSYTRHKLSLFGLNHTDETIELTRKDKNILQEIQDGTIRQSNKYNHSEIFGAIYRDITLSHTNENHQAMSEFPETDVTLVIVDGVLNEIFSMSAFERGAIHLQETKGIKFFVPEVKGTKSSKYNALLLKEQLTEYMVNHPDEKLWLLCFSKGGVDSLHFLHDNNEFAEKHIVGISTIASPITGSDRVNHKLIKKLEQFHKLSDTKFYEYLDRHYDILFKNMIYSLAAHYQAPWFRENHDDLPKNIFYTAFALESEWYESHLWMALTKMFFQSKKRNDGIVDVDQAQFPAYFDGINLGIYKGHHLIGTRSSFFAQEALLEAHLIFFKAMNLL